MNEYPRDTFAPTPGQRIRVLFSDCCVNGEVIGVLQGFEDGGGWPMYRLRFEHAVIEVSAFDWEPLPDEC